MPFEITHLAVGLGVNSGISPSYVAGLIYPDVRYLANIERKLTHNLDLIMGCGDADFVIGVKTHLETDRCWDRLVGRRDFVRPDESLNEG